jgi:hypothetical protein
MDLDQDVPKLDMKRVAFSIASLLHDKESEGDASVDSLQEEESKAESSGVMQALNKSVSFDQDNHQQTSGTLTIVCSSASLK